MVFEKLTSISRATKPVLAPKPPSLKEIREDLEKTSARDVAFTNTSMVHLSVPEGMAKNEGSIL